MFTAIEFGRVSRTEAAPRRAVRSWGGRTLATVLVSSDLFVITLASALATYFRNTLPLFHPTLDVAENVGTVAGLFLFLWLAFLLVGGAYRSKQTGEGTKEYWSVLSSSLAAASAVAITAYLTGYDLSRGFFVLAFGIGIPLLMLSRYAIRRATRRLRSKGILATGILVAGSRAHVDFLIDVLQRERWLGYTILGALLSDSREGSIKGIPVIGRPEEAVEAVGRYNAEGVIFAAGSLEQPGMFNAMARRLEDNKAQMIVMPTLTDISAERVNVRPMAGIPLMFVERPRARKAASWGKRTFDLIGSLSLILVLLPLMGAIALAIKVEDRGPVFFRQRRSGLKGQAFDCLKFRSMVVDAEAHLSELTPRNDGCGVLFKVKDDPRVTRIGRFIRRFSLDELPQLFNVARGQMSLIGPRPALPFEVARYQEHVLRRLDVRPGMTGLWQVSGRSDLSWDETVRLDLYYVDNWSMLQDLNILGRTFGAVLRGTGAY